MNLKKIIAAVASAVVAVSAMAVSAFAAQDASALAEGTAYLNINNDAWSEFEATWTNVEVTGNGTYTVSMEAAEAINLAQFNALEILNGEVLFGRTYTVTVDSIKINGAEAKIAEGYTCSADGSAITTRVNLYNEWNNPSEELDDQGVCDCRSADGDFMSKSARMIDASSLQGVESIEVTFTVAGLAFDAAPAEDAADEAPAAEPAPEAPAADTNTAPAPTGNVPAAAVAVVMVAAGAAAVASKRK